MQPQFTTSQIEQTLINFAANNESKFIKALEYIGEEFVNRARMVNSYEDQSGNLRSSIGYIIAKNGRSIRRNYVDTGGANDGVTEGLNLADEAATLNSNGIVLIVTAGMNYALYVEAMGYDVLSGSIPSRTQVVDSFIQMLL